MRKFFHTLLLIMLLSLLSACFDAKIEEEPSMMQEFNHAAAQPKILPAASNVQANSSESITNIDFRYIYRGFSPVSLDDASQMEAYMAFGTKVIVNENDWNTFLSSFCPGIPYYEPWDFSQECLIASIVSGARPAYANSNTITSLSWENGYFAFEYENDPKNYLYALNSNDITHFYVEIIAISKESLPEGAAVLKYHS